MSEGCSMHIQKCHNETHYFIQLVYANKIWEQNILTDQKDYQIDYWFAFGIYLCIYTYTYTYKYMHHSLGEANLALIPTPVVFPLCSAAHPTMPNICMHTEIHIYIFLLLGTVNTLQFSKRDLVFTCHIRLWVGLDRGWDGERELKTYSVPSVQNWLTEYLLYLVESEVKVMRSSTYTCKN
jgi:hypothetical protein